LEGVGAELEAYLVVALAGGAVGDGVGALGARDLDHLLGDQRARERGAQQVVPLVDGAGAQHGEHELLDELAAQVDRVGAYGAGGERLDARLLDLLALADVGGEGHHLGAVRLLDPVEDHRGVEPARVGEHHLLDLLVVLLHGVSCVGARRAAAPAGTRRPALPGAPKRPERRWVSVGEGLRGGWWREAGSSASSSVVSTGPDSYASGSITM